MLTTRWLGEQWDRRGLPVVFLTMLVLSLYTTRNSAWSVDVAWTYVRSLLFFYMIWRIIRQGQLAVQELRERDMARLTILKSAEDYAKSQADIAEELRIFTEKTTLKVSKDLDLIRKELAKNTELTIKTGAESKEAIHVANNVNEKIVQAHDEVIEKIKEITRVVAEKHTGE